MYSVAFNVLIEIWKAYQLQKLTHRECKEEIIKDLLIENFCARDVLLGWIEV